MGTYEPVEQGDPSVQVAAPSGETQWVDAFHCASDLARFIDEIAGQGSARARTWRMTAHTGFGGLEPTTEWPLELLSEIARGVATQGAPFVKWVDAVGITRLTEQAGSVLEAHEECDRGTHRDRAAFARDEIAARGGLRHVGWDENEANFDFEEYAETYENDGTLLIVADPTGGVRVYDLENLPSAPRPRQPEGVGLG